MHDKAQFDAGDVLLGRYLIRDILGVGGMGEVYRAIDTTTKETVAIKVLHASANSQQAMILTHEARAVAKMHHPNIVRLLDFGSMDAGRFIVMEYCPGADLTAWMEVLDLADMVQVLDGVLAGLACAHARGVIHRDLKPDNVLIIEDADGKLHPKLVDFGIARVNDGQTLAMGVAGTPAYMAPEQAIGKGRLVGRETDLWAVGSMLYEFVSGEIPFDRDTAIAIMMAVVNAEVPPLTARPGIVVPNGLEAIIMRLLEKKTWKRFRFAADVRRALRQLDTNVSGYKRRRTSVFSMPAINVDTMDPAFLAAMMGEAEADEPEERVGVKTLVTGGDDVSSMSDVAVVPELFDGEELPMIGREVLRDHLWDLLEVVLQNRSVRIVVLTGPRGIGKSRVARWLCEQAEEEGLAARLSCGVGNNTLVPGGGLDALLERHLRLQPLNRTEAMAVLEEELVDRGIIDHAHATKVLQYLRPSTEVDVLSGQHTNPIGLAARVLRETATVDPFVIWLDDLAGDDAMIFAEMIELLVLSRRFTSMQLYILVTMDIPTPAAPAVDHEVFKRLNNLSKAESRAVHWVELHPMSVPEMDTLVGAMLPLDPETRAKIVEVVGGSPQTAIDLVTQWFEEGVIKPTGLGTLTFDSEGGHSGEVDYLHTRLQKVLETASNPMDVPRILELAAVIGLEFAEEILAHAFAADSEGTPPLLRETWEKLVDQGIWKETAQGRGRWATEGLLDYVQQRLVRPAQSVKLHGLVANAMLELYGNAVHADDELAEHYVKAGMYEEATWHVLRYAQQATVWGRYDDANDGFSVVKDLVSRHAMTEAAHFMDQADLGLAYVALQRSEFDNAEPHIQAIRDRARPGVRDLSRGLASWLRGELARNRGDLDRAERYYDAALQILGPLREPWAFGRALQGKASLMSTLGRHDKARDLVDKAREIHSEVRQALEIARCSLIAGKAAAAQGEHADAERLFEEAIGIFDAEGARHNAADARLGMIDVLVQTHRYPDAMALVEQTIEDYLDVGDRASLARTQWVAGAIHLHTGAFVQAETTFEVGLEIADSIGAQALAGQLRNGLGDVARKAGENYKAIKHYQAFLDGARESGDVVSAAVAQANLGLSYLNLDNAEAAIRALETAVEAFRNLDHHPWLVSFMACLAQAYATAERWDNARRVFEDAVMLDELTPVDEDEFLDALEAFAEQGQDMLETQATRARDIVASRRQT